MGPMGPTPWDTHFARASQCAPCPHGAHGTPPHGTHARTHARTYALLTLVGPSSMLMLMFRTHARTHALLTLVGSSPLAADEQQAAQLARLLSLSSPAPELPPPAPELPGAHASAREEPGARGGAADARAGVADARGGVADAGAAADTRAGAADPRGAAADARGEQLSALRLLLLRQQVHRRVLDIDGCLTLTAA